MATTGYDGTITLSTKVETSGVEKGLGRIKNKISEFASTREKFVILSNAIREQKKLIAELEREYARLFAEAGSSPEAQAVKENIETQKKSLKELQDALKALGSKGAENAGKLSDAFKAFGKRIARILKDVLIFSVVTRTLRAMYEALQKALMADEEFREDWEEMKAALYTAVQPLIAVIVPAMRVIVGLVREWAVNIGKIGAALMGMSYEELAEQAKNTQKAAENYDKMADSSAETAKNVKKQLAAFDDIQILSSGSDADKAGADLSAYDRIGFGEDDAAIAKKMRILSAALAVAGIAAIVLGVLLCTAGLWGTGIKLIAVGAATVTGTVIANWDAIKDQFVYIFKNFGGIIALIGAGVLVLGVFLCVAGLWGAGIACIAAGVALLGFDVVLNWDAIKDKVIEIFEDYGDVVAYVGVGILVLGVFLCVAQQWVAGIACIAAGAALAGYEIALNWDAIKDKVVEIFEGYGDYLAGMGAVMLVFGILLCVAQLWGAGIACIAAGAAIIGIDVTVNWDAISNKIVELAKDWGGLMAGLGAAAIVIGILCCVGGLWAVGIPLIIAGAGAIATPIAVNWGAITNWLSNLWQSVSGWFSRVWQSIVKFWNNNIAQVFTVKFWSDLAKTCGNGLISGFEAAVNAVIWLFEKMINFVVSGLNVMIRGISAVSGAVGDLIGKDWRIPEIPEATLKRVSIPRLAQGAVIPANREFLAVLGDQKQGTNIEAPADLIKQMVLEALRENGGQTTKEEHYYLNETELMSIVYKLVKGGERLKGGSLVQGGV